MCDIYRSTLSAFTVNVVVCFLFFVVVVVVVFFFLLFYSFYLSPQWYHPSGRPNRYDVCNLHNSHEPNNWLRSYVIEVGDIERLDVTFRYFSHRCNPPVGFCKEYFYAYVWESNTSVTEQQIPHPINAFQLYRLFANITRQSDQETNLTVPLQVTSKYIVLGIRDQGGCRILYSVKVHYKFCNKKTLEHNLASFPSILAQIESIPVQGICIANFRQIVPGNLTIFCDSDGEWNTSRLESRCVCEEDLENREEMCTGMCVLFLSSLLPFMSSLRYFVCFIHFISFYKLLLLFCYCYTITGPLSQRC